MSKTIVVEWVEQSGHNPFWSKEMRVVSSTHKRFVVGYRFDFGFFSIATDEGYTIISLPQNESEGK